MFDFDNTKLETEYTPVNCQTMGNVVHIIGRGANCQQVDKVPADDADDTGIYSGPYSVLHFPLCRNIAQMTQINLLR
jgi:hypothetical protein